MILVNRCDEPEDLAGVRTTQLEALRKLGRNPTSNEISGYRTDGVLAALRASQYHKCCYCEEKIKKRYHDVDHYRPKAEADRRPGCSETHGYWWLAFDWENLLFACPSCNRSGKRAKFPLDVGSGVLAVGEKPHGDEKPLLLDPGGNINPVVHIEFKLRKFKPGSPNEDWCADPRNGSLLGQMTISAIDLNHQEYRDVRNDHVHEIEAGWVEPLRAAIKQGRTQSIRKAYENAITLFEPRARHAALAYDVLRHFIPKPSPGLAWPEPSEVCPRR